MTLTWQDWATIAALAVGIVGVLIGIYFAENRNMSQPFKDRYAGIYKKYKLYSISRESAKGSPSENVIIEWDIEVRKRYFKVPEIIITFESPNPGWRRRYVGDLKYTAQTMHLVLAERLGEEADFWAIVFKRPANNVIDIQAGFGCGYSDISRPYCGPCLISANQIKKAIVKDILYKAPNLSHKDMEDILSKREQEVYYSE